MYYRQEAIILRLNSKGKKQKLFELREWVPLHDLQSPEQLAAHARPRLNCLEQM